jgi:serine-type D-Ala-D-Ala carboxypeptidase/endopeptidase
VLAFAQAPYDLSELDRILQSAVGPFTPGISLALEQNGAAIYSKTFGSFNPNAAIPIASATKWYSGAVVMALVEGRLALDDRVSKYLPEYTGEKAAITIRQLFSHTSGLPEDAPCIAARDMTLARCAAEIANIPLDAPPGTQFFYGGVSMQVGGRIAEIAGGDTWHHLFEQKIAQPLGFTCTAYDVFSAPANPRIAAGATSCTSDYLRFLRMILQRGFFNGRRVLSPEAVYEMLADQTGGAAIAYSPYQQFARSIPRCRRRVTASASGRSAPIAPARSRSHRHKARSASRRSSTSSET